MRIAKRLVLLIVLLTGWQVFTVVTRADDPCTQGCSQSYSSCLADGNDEKNQCYTQAEWDYQSCDLSASESAHNCAENCYDTYILGGINDYQGYQDCYYNECAAELQNADEECNQSYDSDTASCNVNQDKANQDCANQYNACVNNCQMATPTPTP
jgi:hypothetical protein